MDGLLIQFCAKNSLETTLFLQSTKMTTIGYIRVSTEEQDLDKQRHLLLDYAHHQQIRIDEFIAVEMSSRKNQQARRITEQVDKLQSGDLLIVAELSRLGRNMLETLKLINVLTSLTGLFQFSLEKA